MHNDKTLFSPWRCFLTLGEHNWVESDRKKVEGFSPSKKLAYWIYNLDTEVSSNIEWLLKVEIVSFSFTKLGNTMTTPVTFSW